MARLSISRETIAADVELLKVSGDVDAHTFEDLESAMTEVFAQGCYRLIIDATDVVYVSSAGAGVLMAATLETEANAGKIVVLNPAAATLDVLDLLGLTPLLTIANSREEALALVRK